MNKLNFFLLFMIFGITQTIAQDNAPEEKNPYNKYRNEIGIDIQNLFGSGQVGTGLIYKRRLKNKENSSPNKNRALVFEVFANGAVSLKTPSDYDIGSMSTQEIRNIFNNSYSFTALIGMEWQYQKNKVQSYYGMETGYKRLVNTNASSFFTNSGSIGNHFLELTKEKQNTIPFHIYGGIKYFLSPRFSVSVDSKFRIDLEATFIQKNATGSDLIEDTKEKGPKSYKLDYYLDFLNSINFSYYF